MSKPFADLTLPIVGADYPNKRGPTRRFEIAVCRPGDPVQLVPEPKNPADEHAVAVYSERDVQMGYIPSQRAVRISKMIREGVEIVALFQQQTEWGGLVRLSFDGTVPDLPPDFDDESPAPDFYPDEIYPDD